MMRPPPSNTIIQRQLWHTLTLFHPFIPFPQTERVKQVVNPKNWVTERKTRILFSPYLIQQAVLDGDKLCCKVRNSGNSTQAETKMWKKKKMLKVKQNYLEICFSNSE